MRKFVTLCFHVVGFAVLASCSGDMMSRAPLVPTTATNSSQWGTSLASIAITPSTGPIMFVGTTAPLIATVLNYLGVPVPLTVTWVSIDATIASVSALGVVSARKAGSVIVTANSGEHTDSVVVTVLLVPVKTLNVLAPASLVLGTSAQSIAQPLDSTGALLTGRPVAWSSRSPAVASVSSTGLITGLSAGTAIINAVVGGVSTSVTVTVFGTLNSVAVHLPLASVPVLSTLQASAILLDAAGAVLSGYPVAWSSSNPGVAVVSAAGVVTALAPGNATIIATSNGKSGSAALTVFTTTTSPSLPAALPNVYLTTTAPVAPAAGGVVINVAAGGNLQTALNTAKPGDVIALANGAVFSGNFVMPNKNTTSTNWIVIRPANVSLLPAEGARMTPTIAAAANLPKIQTPNTSAALFTALGAHHYRVIGIEVNLAPAVVANGGLVRLGEDASNGQTTLASIAHDLVLDRVYVHGSATQTERRCIAMNSAYTAVIDSHVSDCHEAGADAQAIAGWNGPGPFKIVNNYLEGSGENVAFGGVDPGIANLVPSDIEIRGNHFFKPVSWKGKWTVKNIFELKNAQRVLVQGNILENNWLDGQGGSAVNLKSTNQSGGCAWCGTRDVTFRLNLIRNVGAGFNLSAAPDPNISNFHLQRISISDNVVTNIDVAPFNGDGRGFLINQDVVDLVIAHNTLISPTTSAIGFGGPLTQPTIRMSVRDNITGGGAYGMKGPGLTAGIVTLLALMPGGQFLGNVIIQASGLGYPTGNLFPATTGGLGFANAAALDFRLLASSAYKGRATDGRDPGADVVAVNAAIQNVIVP